MASVKWNRDTDKPTGVVNLVGSASLMKLKPNIPQTQILRKGDCFPKTNARLQADNYAIHFDDLEHDWDKVIGYIISHEPPDTGNYPNPYSGKTTEEILNTRYNHETATVPSTKNILARFI